MAVEIFFISSYFIIFISISYYILFSHIICSTQPM